MKTFYLPSWIVCALLYAYPCPQSIGSSSPADPIPYEELAEKMPAVKKVVDRYFDDKKEDLVLMVSDMLLLSQGGSFEYLNPELDRLDQAYLHEVILPAIGEHQDVLTNKGNKMTLQEDKALVESLFKRRNATYRPESKADTPTSTHLTFMLSKDPKQVADQENILRNIRTHAIAICQAINTNRRYRVKKDTGSRYKLWSGAGLAAAGVAVGALFSRKKKPSQDKTGDKKTGGNDPQPAQA